MRLIRSARIAAGIPIIAQVPLKNSILIDSVRKSVLMVDVIEQGSITMRRIILPHEKTLHSQPEKVGIGVKHAQQLLNFCPFVASATKREPRKNTINL